MTPEEYQRRIRERQYQTSWAMNGANAPGGATGSGYASIIASNPNLAYEQNIAAGQLAEDTLADRTIIQGLNGPQEFVKDSSGAVVPAPGSLGAITWRNAGGTMGNGPNAGTQLSGLHS